MGASALAIVTPSARRMRAAVCLGDVNEARVLKAARRIDAWWFISARRTRHGSPQDRLGWDVVIETRDVGRIILQVKSTERAAREFSAYGRRLRLVAPIYVVVADRDATPEVLFGRVLGTCIRAREAALEAGLTADDPRLCRRAA